MIAVRLSVNRAPVVFIPNNKRCRLSGTQRSRLLQLTEIATALATASLIEKPLSFEFLMPVARACALCGGEGVVAHKLSPCM